MLGSSRMEPSLLKLYDVAQCVLQSSTDQIYQSELYWQTESHGSAENPALQCIHPLDKLVLIYLFADDQLRKELTSRLTRAQLSIPIILPPVKSRSAELLLWPFFGLTQTVQDPTRSKDSEVDIIDSEFFIAVFVRIGATRHSKSQLASKLVNKSDQHLPFFSRSSRIKDATKLVSTGMVDGFWTEDLSIFVLNYHGCCSHDPKMLTYLTENAHATVVLTDAAALDKEHAECLAGITKSCQNYCIVLNSSSRAVPESKTYSKFQNYENWIEWGENSEDFIEKKLEAKIRELARQSSTKSIREFAEKAQENGISIDTSKQICTEAIKEAEGLINKFADQQKPQILPLQTRAIEMTQLEKEFYRYRSLNANHGHEAIEMKQNFLSEMKKKQIADVETIISDRNSVIHEFLETLINFHKTDKNIESARYFISALKLKLDLQNRKRSKPLMEKYSQLIEAQEGAYSNDFESDKCLEEIRSLKFSTDELFREVALIYAGCKLINIPISQRNILSSVTKLPVFAAEHLMKGLPLEIMNGDAGSVQIDWLREVLNSVARKIGENAKVAVLSILGIQSSGKSTLLNTMFGLNFSVSSGRCTRGIYCQLVPAHAMRNINADYIILLDTEGLRAPELKSSTEGNERDNELATLVVGLADLTIINIMGETDSEINETLQIAVHALLRMKISDLTPKCMVIHQNVNDNMTFENTAPSRRNLQKILDEATEDAALLENCSDTIKQFRDVIDFNYNDRGQVWYLPSLYSGTRISERYSMKAAKFTEAVIDKLASVQVYGLAGFQERLSILWKSVQKEDFVFSFRNAREIKAFRELQTKMQNWSWTLYKTGSEWIREASNRINTCKIEKLDDLNHTLELDLLAVLDRKIENEIMGDFKQFFARPDYRKILVQWESMQEGKLRCLKDQIVQSKLKASEDQMLTRKTKDKITKDQARIETEFMKLARESFYAEEMNGNFSQEELNKAFEEKWNKVIHQLQIDVGFADIKPCNIENLVQSSLKSVFPNAMNAIDSAIKYRTPKYNFDWLKSLNPVKLTKERFFKKKKFNFSLNRKLDRISR